MKNPLRWLSLLWLVGAACAHENAVFTVDASAGAIPTHTRVSVFGSMRDGRMSTDYWEELGPFVAKAFGRDSCDTLFSDHMQKNEPDLFSQIEQDTKNNGLNTDLLTKLSPRASGDLILALQVTGKPHEPKVVDPATDQAAGAAEGQNMGYGGRKPNRHPAAFPGVDNGDDFEIYGLLYSPEQKVIVARVKLRYWGYSASEALQQFADKLHATMPEATCSGWKPATDTGAKG